MRRVILVTALVLLSASAQAGPSRGLTLVSNDEPVVAEQPKTADTSKAVEAPKTDAKTDPSKSTPEKAAEKPKPKRESTEARLIYELHRHGIYW